MLNIEWLMRLPHADGILIVKKIAISANTSSEAITEAQNLWMTLRLRETNRPDGFQIVDHDGQMLAGPRFLQSGEFAA